MTYFKWSANEILNAKLNVSRELSERQLWTTSFHDMEGMDRVSILIHSLLIQHRSFGGSNWTTSARPICVTELNTWQMLRNFIMWTISSTNSDGSSQGVAQQQGDSPTEEGHDTQPTRPAYSSTRIRIYDDSVCICEFHIDKVWAEADQSNSQPDGLLPHGCSDALYRVVPDYLLKEMDALWWFDGSHWSCIRTDANLFESLRYHYDPTLVEQWLHLYIGDEARHVLEWGAPAEPEI